MSITLKSLKPGLPIAGRRMALGQTFKVSGESQARVLCAIGAAERVAEAAPAPTYNTRMLTARAGRQMVAAPALPASAYAPDSAPVKVNHAADDLEGMDRDALYELAISLGMKPHALTGAAKLRAAIAEHRAAQ